MQLHSSPWPSGSLWEDRSRDDAAAASFFVLMGAAGFSMSSKAGVVLLEVKDTLTARSLSFNSRSFPTGNVTFDRVYQEIIGLLRMPFIESSISADVKMHELRMFNLPEQCITQ